MDYAEIPPALKQNVVSNRRYMELCINESIGRWNCHITWTCRKYIQIQNQSAAESAIYKFSWKDCCQIYRFISIYSDLLEFISIYRYIFISIFELDSDVAIRFLRIPIFDIVYWFIPIF